MFYLVEFSIYQQSQAKKYFRANADKATNRHESNGGGELIPIKTIKHQ